MIYLISDTHFYHENIIEYCKRPFKNVEEMNEVLIRNWNEVVGVNDEVYHLGDFTIAVGEGSYKDKWLKTSETLLKKLNGKKYLIRGNHDPAKKICEQVFDKVYTSCMLGDFKLRHEPLNNDKYIHGHVHDKKPFFYDGNFNVSVEVCEYKPVLFDEVVKYYESALQR